MGKLRMRVYYGPETSGAAPRGAAPGRETITVPLGDICDLLADAAATRRTWLEDFRDDEVTISSDLYDVLMAYRFYRSS